MLFVSYVSVRRSIAAACAVGAIAGIAGPRNASAQGGPPPLPPEALAACESKGQGDACVVKLHEHEIKGSCTKEPSGSRLFCLPSDAPPFPPR